MIGWLRDLLGRRRPAPLAPAARELLMHLMGPMAHALCGEPWGPAAPLTIEEKAVTCPKCKRMVQRRAIDRIAKIR